MKKRKGARWLDIGDQRWSYFVGQRFVEIRSPSNVKTLVPREAMDVFLQGCECCGEGSGLATQPGRIAAYIRTNLRAQYEAQSA